MKLTILGCYSATPRKLNNPTAQVLEIKNHLFLVDCGEGTQVQLRKSKVKFSRIKHIFISHLHGDHFFGLPGLISTFRLLGREADLHIYGPKGIKEAITLLLKLGDSWTNYKLFFHELISKESELIYEDDNVTVHTIPLNHRVYTNGFLFREKPSPRTLNIEAVAKYKIDKSQFNNIKSGKDVIVDDRLTVANSKLTFDPPKTKSYAFCSDTAYKEDIIPQIKNVDLLYHEATFLETEQHLCAKTKHTTAKQAATIAKKASVGQLVLGHYSTRYKSLDSFKEEAQQVFENVLLADDGECFEIW
ncbi:ribonuclease Z [Croceitalea rosinachiae]|uniref:Ribonuclease Z n=1 Tax=Croceitalea rosinachiae TaxID=3075596 RepID=A0ABU3AEA0_9FLAO|nr:ribonuclease Z [Croceitalea sp. F388]MDT0608511.1 ribonuclease Z [Croceitalea sp. F388]